MNNTFNQKSNNVKLSIDQIMGLNYIRYDKLTEIINRAFVGSTATEINLYIDLYSIFKPLYKYDMYNIEEYKKVFVNIINMIGHYKEFFRTRYNVYTNTYMVYSKNIPVSNRQEHYNYNSNTMNMYYNNKMIDDMISNNIELLEIVAPYLPDSYLLKCDSETGVLIYDLIKTSNNTNPNIIITKDVYLYQLCNIKDVTIIRPNKYRGYDTSYYINKSNLLYSYINERKATYNDKYNYIDSKLLSLIMTLSSLKERNIPVLYNINIAIDKILDSIKNMKIINGYNSIIGLYNNLCIDHSKINLNEFEKRFKVIDIPTQHQLFKNTIECKKYKNDIRNLYDPNAIKEINQKYFSTNPLHLDYL